MTFHSCPISPQPELPYSDLSFLSHIPTAWTSLQWPFIPAPSHHSLNFPTVTFHSCPISSQPELPYSNLLFLSHIPTAWTSLQWPFIPVPYPHSLNFPTVTFHSCPISPQPELPYSDLSFLPHLTKTWMYNCPTWSVLELYTCTLLRNSASNQWRWDPDPASGGVPQQ